MMPILRITPDDVIVAGVLWCLLGVALGLILGVIFYSGDD